MTASDYPPSFDKARLSDLAIFGGRPLFARYLSTSNLVRPDIERFLEYSRTMYEGRCYTGGGPLVRLLETRLAEVHRVKHCVALSGGFWAVVLTLKCLALPGRSEVVMPSLTYRKLADIACWAGLIPRFCEVDPETLTMTAATVEPHINEDTALILGVHPTVGRCPVDELVDLARRRALPLVFDSVEAAGDTYGGQPIGCFGDAECFSMHASKLLNGFEGGLVTTDNAALAARLSGTRDFGSDGPHRMVGMNSKLNEVHAAMALACLDDLDAQMERNRARYERYRSVLRAVDGVRLLEFGEGERRTYKNIVVELLDGWPLSREDTLAIFHAEKAMARPYYSPPLHLVKTSYPTRAGDLRQTERLAKKFMLLPCGELVHEAEIEQMGALLGFMHRHAADIKARLHP